jgi:hypothetical protein
MCINYIKSVQSIINPCNFSDQFTSNLLAPSRALTRDEWLGFGGDVELVARPTHKEWGRGKSNLERWGRCRVHHGRRERRRVRPPRAIAARLGRRGGQQALARRASAGATAAHPGHEVPACVSRRCGSRAVGAACPRWDPPPWGGRGASSCGRSWPSLRFA